MKRPPSIDQRGVSYTISTIFFFMLAFTALSVIIYSYGGYNQAFIDEDRIAYERSLEKISISNIGVNNSQLLNVSISNNGTIEVKIRALYIIDSNGNRFICDPSTYIAPSKSNTIILSPPEPLAGEAKVVAVTERGVKSKEYPVRAPSSPSIPEDYDTNNLFAGPLMLRFDRFYYEPVPASGDLDPDGWMPGWVIPKNMGYIAWNITVKNIDNSTDYIIIDRFSSLTLFPLGTAGPLTWYLEPTDLKLNEWEQKIPFNRTVHIVFIWSNYKVKPPEGGTNKPQEMNLPEGECMVFLTFFGRIQKVDGRLVTYGQTIPFEAAVTIGG
ncbi:MAG: hypothetical protein ACUVV4_04340 [Candidatus Bathyarchaeia archaeon]